MTYVLIVEDDPDVARLLAEAMGEGGHATHVISASALVPAVIAWRRPVLIVLDLPHEGRSRADAFDVRDDPRYDGIPMLFLTGEPDAVEASSAASRLHRVMRKPFDVDDLVATASHLIRRTEEHPKTEEAAA